MHGNDRPHAQGTSAARNEASARRRRRSANISARPGDRAASLPDARTFGEPTAGLTTDTQIYTLADGSLLTLPVAVMGDGEGKAVDGAISPEEPAAIGDWPTDDDAAVASAQ